MWLEPRTEGGSRAQVTQHLRPGTTQRARGPSQRVASVNQVHCLCEGRDHPGLQGLHGVPTGTQAGFEFVPEAELTGLASGLDAGRETKRNEGSKFQT